MSSPFCEHPLRYLTALVPYVAVALGLYVFECGWASILLYHLGIGAVLVVSGYGPGRARLLEGWRVGPVLLLALAFLASGPLLFLLWPCVKQAAVDLPVKLYALGLDGGVWWAFMVYYALVNPFVEELFWRGYLGSNARGITGSDLLFGGYHWVVLACFVDLGWNIFTVAVLIGAGWLWRQLAHRLGGHAFGVFTHAVADISVIVAAHQIGKYYVG